MIYSIGHSSSMSVFYMRFACYRCSLRVSLGRKRRIDESLRGESFGSRWG